MKMGNKALEILRYGQDGNELKLDDFKGQKLVLYFYPRNSTPGYTTETCNLCNNYERFLAQGCAVVGVSIQDEKSHKKFTEKHQLPFPLVTDTEKMLNNVLGVWGEKNMYGKRYMGTFRTTFIIDEEGRIERTITPKKIRVKEHAQQILG